MCGLLISPSKYCKKTCNNLFFRVTVSLCWTPSASIRNGSIRAMIRIQLIGTWPFTFQVKQKQDPDTGDGILERQF
jgi:hypothetical protein